MNQILYNQTLMSSQLLPSLPLIFCPTHPSFQLNLICRLPSCSNKGAICCRCLVKQHYGNGHDVDSIMPIDELIILMQDLVNFKKPSIGRQVGLNERIQVFEEKIQNEIQNNEEKAQKLAESYSETNQKMKQQVCLSLELSNEKRALELLKELTLFEREKLQEEQETPTAMGHSIILEMNKKKELIQLFPQIANKVILKDGQFSFDLEHVENHLETSIKNFEYTCQFTSDMQHQTANMLRNLELANSFLRNGLTIGINKNLPKDHFSSWQLIYDQPYSHKCTFKYLSSLLANEGDLFCIAATENDTVLLCGIDFGKNIFEATKEARVARKSANAQIHWYLVASKSFGFSPTEEINLKDADCGTTGDRLSWNLNGDGGYRVGDQIELYKNAQIRKQIYQFRLR